MIRPRPRATGKQNPAMQNFESPTPPQEANARQLVPKQLSSLKARAAAAKGMVK